MGIISSLTGIAHSTFALAKSGNSCDDQNLGSCTSTDAFAGGPSLLRGRYWRGAGAKFHADDAFLRGWPQPVPDGISACSQKFRQADDMPQSVLRGPFNRQHDHRRRRSLLLG